MATSENTSSKRKMIPIVLMGLWLVVLTVVLVFMFMKTGDDEGKKKIAGKQTVSGKIAKRSVTHPLSSSDENQLTGQVRNLDSRMNQVEAKLATLTGLDQTVTRVEECSKTLEEMKQRLDTVEAKLLAMADAKGSAPTLPQTSPPKQDTTTDTSHRVVEKKQPPKSKPDQIKKAKSQPTKSIKKKPRKAVAKKTRTSMPYAWSPKKVKPTRKSLKAEKRVPALVTTPFKPVAKHSSTPSKAVPAAGPGESPSRTESGLNGTLYELSMKYPLIYDLDPAMQRRLKKMAPGIAVYPGKYLLVPGEPSKIGG